MRATDKTALERYKKKLELIRSKSNVNPNETQLDKKEAIERCKKDVEFLVQRYFPHYATSKCADFQLEWAKKVKKDKNFTGFAKWGRGSAKSVWNNVIIPFWLWMNEGKTYFVLIGTSEKKAARLLEDLRAEFESNPQIIADFGEQKNLGNWDESLWVTKSGFIGHALGFGQSCRGLRVGEQRPNYYNLDDLESRQTIKNEKRQDEMVEWVENELLPSMDSDRERLLISNNWFAVKMFVRKLAEKHPDWTVHEVKAYNPVTYEPTWKAKYKPDYFLNKEQKMGTIACLAEYNHEAKPSGKIFKPEMIQWGKAPNLNHFKIIVGHWDVAYAGTETADFNAVKVWGLDKNNNFWLLDSYVKQSKMRGAVEWMCNMQKRLPETAMIHWRYESQFWNGELERTIREVEQLNGINLNISSVNTPRTKKYDRILVLHPYYQNGRMYYSEKLIPHNDTQVGLAQLFGIEPGYNTHDDSPDADEQAVKFLEAYVSMGGGKMKWESGKMEHKNERI